jgi:hypothetical protein
MVHLYGLFPLRTSSSKPAVKTVSQLILLLVDISRAVLDTSLNLHIDNGHDMINLDISDVIWTTCS